jgi:hypothetical protein
MKENKQVNGVLDIIHETKSILLGNPKFWTQVMQIYITSRWCKTNFRRAQDPNRQAERFRPRVPPPSRFDRHQPADRHGLHRWSPRHFSWGGESRWQCPMGSGYAFELVHIFVWSMLWTMHWDVDFEFNYVTIWTMLCYSMLDLNLMCMCNDLVRCVLFDIFVLFHSENHGVLEDNHTLFHII